MLSFATLHGRESLFEEIKRYVRFTEADVRLLVAFKPYAQPYFPAIAEEFYDRIREHEQANDVLAAEEQVGRLKDSLVRWMHRLTTGPYDESYFDDTAKIGRMHVRVGLPQRYMLTAVALIRQAFERIAEEVMRPEAGPTRQAIGKVLDIDLAIMLEAYRDDFVARAQRVERLEREEVGRALAKTEHRYRNAVELARVIVIGLDPQGTVRLFNTEAERVTGLAREDVLGASFVETLVPEGLREEHGAMLREAAAGKRAATDVLESALRTRAGKIRDVRWQLAYAPSELGDDVVLFAIGQDTTDQNALAARVRQTEKLAAVGTLAAGLAHEIRNPLNGAQLHVTFLERGLARAGFQDPDTLDAVRVVREEIRRLSALVSEFLDFARPKPLVTRPASLVALCQRAVQMVSDASALEVAVKTDLPAVDVTLELDPGRMEQVLLNLLRNAIEAVGATGGGHVTLRARRLPRHVVLEVEDEGPGVASPDAPIFDPFFSTKPHGTGLGLAIVHRIVTDHEGTVEFTSRPGRTIFRVTLPIRLTG